MSTSTLQFWDSTHGKFPCIQYDDALFFKRTSKQACRDVETGEFLRLSHTFECCNENCKAKITVTVRRQPGCASFPSLLEENTNFEIYENNTVHTCTENDRKQNIERRAFRQELYKRIRCVEVCSSRSEPRRVFKALRREFAQTIDNTAVVVPAWRSIRHSTRRLVLNNIERSPSTMDELFELDSIPAELSVTIGNNPAVFVLSSFIVM